MTVKITMDKLAIDRISSFIYRLSKKAREAWPEFLLDKMANELRSRIYYYMPERTGRLRKSIIIDRGPGWRSVEVTAPYTLYVEDGVRPHIIKPRVKKALAFRKDDEIVVRKKVMHPGFSGRKFFKKAFDEMRIRIREILMEHFERELDRIRAVLEEY